MADETTQLDKGRANFEELREKGTLGYIALGSCFVDFVQNEENTLLLEALGGKSSEQMGQVVSHARGMLDKEFNHSLVDLLDEERDSLWIEAMKSGLGSTLSDYKNTSNQNFQSVFGQLSDIRSRVTFSSGLRAAVINSVLSTIFISLLIFAANFALDNPLGSLVEGVSKLVSNGALGREESGAGN